MSKKEKIEQEINKTLSNLEKTEPLTPDPYFYSRLKAHLDERHKQQNVFSLILKPTLLIALVIINVSTAFWYFNTNGTSQSNARQELLKVLSSDLKLDSGQNTFFLNQ